MVGFLVGINDGGSVGSREGDLVGENVAAKDGILVGAMDGDRKSTRLNSSHVSQSRMPSSA